MCAVMLVGMVNSYGYIDTAYVMWNKESNWYFVLKKRKR